MKEKTKVLAMYLPQFHYVKENEEWWGKNFTDWTAVKKSVPRFPGHNQPEIPLNSNYYDLLDKKTMQWQANLAKKYLIDGFCIYHYWFKNGRKILEKPAENLLKWKDIDIQYCFSWPAESWARTWVGLGNPWADLFENRKNDKDDQIAQGYLLKQQFGNENDWKEHFMYLLPFFKDERYIRIDGKPIFHFYSSASMPCYERMVLYWKKLACEHGLKGLYTVGQDAPSPVSDATVHRMYPGITQMLNGDVYDNLRVYSYSETWERFLQLLPYSDTQTVWTCMVSYDDTPRRGANAEILSGFTTRSFMSYLTKLLEKAISNSNPAVFLNAWNEWGEGMHLEPDEVNGYDILESVKQARCSIERKRSFCKNTINCSHVLDSEYRITEREKYRFKLYYEMMKSWTILKQHGRNACEYLLHNGYKKIAFYGFGVHGHMFHQEIQSAGADCVFAVDRLNKEKKKQEIIPVFGTEEDWPDCDVMIITIIDKYYEIYVDIKEKLHCPIISLYEVVVEAANE